MRSRNSLGQRVGGPVGFRDFGQSPVTTVPCERLDLSNDWNQVVGIYSHTDGSTLQTDKQSSKNQCPEGGFEVEAPLARFVWFLYIGQRGRFLRERGGTDYSVHKISLRRG